MSNVAELITELLDGRGIPERLEGVSMVQVIGRALLNLKDDPTWGSGRALRPERPRHIRREARLKLPQRRVREGSDQCICSLCRLYRDEGKTLEDIGRATHTCKTTISRWIREHGTVISRSMHRRRREAG